MKNKYFFIIVLLFVFKQSNAQFSYDKLIEKKKYSKALIKILKNYDKKPDNINANYDMSVIFNIPEYEKFNVDTAYYYSVKMENLFEKLDEKASDKYKKRGINLIIIKNQKLKICNNAFTVYENKNTIEGYNHFIKKFTDNTSLTKKALINRNKIAYKNACKINSIESYQSFIDTYPYSDEINEATNKRNELAFKKSKTINTVKFYQYFIDKYPLAKEHNKAITLRDNLAFNIAKNKNRSSAFKSFLNSYPNSKLYKKAYYEHDKLYYFENVKVKNIQSNIYFLENNKKNRYKSAIIDTLYHLSVNKDDFTGLKYLAENTKGNVLNDSAWHHFYKNYTRDGYPSTFQKFYDSFNKFPFNDILNSDYEIALTAIDLELDKGYKSTLKDKYIEYIKAAAEKDLAFMVLITIVEPLIKSKKWKEAIKSVNYYKQYFGEKNKKVNNLLEILSLSDSNIKTKYLSKKINTEKGGEYSPVISADNKYLYFCGRNRTDNLSGEDIFYSENKYGNWQSSKIISELCTSGHDAPESVSTDGNQMLIFKNGDLYFSNRTYSGWSEIEAFPAPINTDSWEADAMITSDGKSIIFVSKREGGQNVIDTDMDIYICLQTEYGWSEPINLGSTINTRNSDRSPYLHSDMKTLYFSSNGHGGLGGLDVFKSTRLNDSLWTEWSEPINMGKEINSIGEDWGYKVSTDGDIAYFSAGNTSEVNDIYTVNLPTYLRPGFVATISGNLVDKNNNPIESIIRWEDLETGKTVGECTSNPKDGSFFIVLPLGKIYGYYIDTDEYFPISNNIDLRTENKPIEVDEDIKMVTFKQMIDDGLAVPVNNLFFPINKDKLLPESLPELMRVANIIKSNNIKVEISGHTDNTGTKEHNLELSNKRAQAVKDFLISLGVNSELITIIGYGDTKPIAVNDTEKGKSKNRRVELKFIN